MRVLCAVGLRSGPELVQRVAEILKAGSELLLVHVVDTGPHHDLKHLIGSLRHGPAGDPGRETELHAAEESAGKAALVETQEAVQAVGFTTSTSLVWGRPEAVILQIAEDEKVSLISMWAREGAGGHPHIGPASVGHTARFVLDHAPCDVLLLRE
jgi:nucleotide-binding universal stress UspA family protein